MTNIEVIAKRVHEQNFPDDYIVYEFRDAFCWSFKDCEECPFKKPNQTEEEQDECVDRMTSLEFWLSEYEGESNA